MTAAGRLEGVKGVMRRLPGTFARMVDGDVTNAIWKTLTIVGQSLELAKEAAAVPFVSMFAAPVFLPHALQASYKQIHLAYEKCKVGRQREALFASGMATDAVGDVLSVARTTGMAALEIAQRVRDVVVPFWTGLLFATFLPTLGLIAGAAISACRVACLIKNAQVLWDLHKVQSAEEFRALMGTEKESFFFQQCSLRSKELLQEIERYLERTDLPPEAYRGLLVRVRGEVERATSSHAVSLAAALLGIAAGLLALAHPELLLVLAILSLVGASVNFTNIVVHKGLDTHFSKKKSTEENTV